MFLGFGATTLLGLSSLAVLGWLLFILAHPFIGIVLTGFGCATVVRLDAHRRHVQRLPLVNVDLSHPEQQNARPLHEQRPGVR